MRFQLIKFLLILLFILTSCTTDDDIKFKGKKIEIHKNNKLVVSNTKNVKIDNILSTNVWSQKGYDKTHTSSNFLLNFPLKKTHLFDTDQELSNLYPNFPQPISDKKNIYVLNTKGNLISIYKNNWKIKWKSKVFFDGNSTSNPGSIVSNPKNYKLYAHNGTNEIIGVNKNTGKIFWRFKNKLPFKGNISIEDDLIVVNDYGNNLISFKNENLIWKKNLGESSKSIYSNVRPLIFKNYVINPANDGLFHILDKENGKFIYSDYLEADKSKVSILHNNDIVANPIIFKNKLFIMSHSGTLATYEMKGFEVLWKLPIGGSKTPTISGNSLFVIDNEGLLIALDIETGVIRWSLKLKNNIEKGYFFKSKIRISFDGPFLINNKLLIFSDNEFLNIVNPFDGKLEKIIKFDRLGSTPIFVNNRMIIINSEGDLKIYK